MMSLPGISALLLCAFAAVSSAAGASDLSGTWMNEKKRVAIRIDNCGDQLCGYIVWLKRSKDANGNPRLDRHNPDPVLQNRTLCGLQILTGFRRLTDATWDDGQIYDPTDGRSYSSNITLEHDGTLKVRGYVGISLLGKTIAWTRVPAPGEPCK